MTPGESCHDYQIQVEGRLSARWQDWFDFLEVHPADEQTSLYLHQADRAALYGLLTQLQNYNVGILLLERLPDREV